METTAKRLRAAMELRGMKQADLVRATGIGKSSISTYLTGEYEPKQKNIYLMAKVLNVSEAWLMGQDAPMERQQFAPIPDGFDPLPETVQLPLVGQIACGTPILAEENITDYIDVPAIWGADFVLQCKGDSMVPRFRDGDVVAIRKQPTVEPGQIAAVRVDGEVALKHVYFTGTQLTLVSENPSYPPMVYGPETLDAAIEGLAVGLMRSLV